MFLFPGSFPAGLGEGSDPPLALDRGRRHYHPGIGQFCRAWPMLPDAVDLVRRRGKGGWYSDRHSNHHDVRVGPGGGHPPGLLILATGYQVQVDLHSLLPLVPCHHPGPGRPLSPRRHRPEVMDRRPQPSPQCRRPAALAHFPAPGANPETGTPSPMAIMIGPDLNPKIFDAGFTGERSRKILPWGACTWGNFYMRKSTRLSKGDTLSLYRP